MCRRSIKSIKNLFILILVLSVFIAIKIFVVISQAEVGCDLLGKQTSDPGHSWDCYTNKITYPYYPWWPDTKLWNRCVAPEVI